MSSMVLNVEFLAGTSITTAVNDAKEKAIAFGFAYIQFKFNEIQISVSRHSNTDDIQSRYYDVLAKNVSYWTVESEVPSV